MRTRTAILLLTPLALSLAIYGQNSPQTPAPATQPATSEPAAPAKGTSAAGDIGRGTGDIGKGVGEGAGKAAEGVGKGAGDLATLHPVGAVKNVGKGAGDAGKDVGVGAAKGTGKIGKGTGKLVAKPFHHPKKTEDSSTPATSGDTSH